MKKLSKILMVVMVLALATSVFFACTTKDTEPETATINVIVPDGAPALAMAELMKDFSYKDYTINFSLVAGTDIATKITKKEADIAIAPTNMASILYNKGVDIKLLSSNVYGLIYLMGGSDVPATDDISDLEGKTIYCTGQGGTPDFVLQYLLQENNVNATIVYKQSGTDIVQLLAADKNSYGVLGEPAATMSVTKAGAKLLFDMQAEWKKLTGFVGYPQASTVVSTEVLETYPDFIKAFYNAMEDNIDYIENNDNIDEINATLEGLNSAVVFSSADVIKKCNLKVVDATTSKTEIESYLNLLKDFNSKLIGDKLPDADFYYDMK